MTELKNKLQELDVDNIPAAMEKATFHMLIGQPVTVLDKTFKIQR